MIKSLLFASVVSASAACVAAEQAPIAQWAQAANHVAVHTIKRSIPVPIGDTSTIGDVKASLLESEGIAVDQQTLQALSRSAWTLWMTQNTSEPLDDAANVKEAMTVYNTKTLALSLRVRRLAAAGATEDRDS